MGKKKTFIKTEISIAEIRLPVADAIVTSSIPESSSLSFGRNATAYRNFGFSPWYGIGIDGVTHAIQTQLARLLQNQDSQVESSTVAIYCRGGIKDFLDYLKLVSSARKHDIEIKDIDRALIDGFIGHLSNNGLAIGTQKNRYNHVKAVLKLLGQRNIINIVLTGDRATFPNNPFPNSNRFSQSDKPLSRKERKDFTAAIKKAAMPLWQQDIAPSSYLLGIAVLIIALHTGRNTTPLLEMEYDCIHPHPKENLSYLILTKRRGHNTSKIVLKKDAPADRLVELTPTIKINVETLIRKIIDLTGTLRDEAPSDLKKRVWLHYAQAGKTAGQIVELSNQMLQICIKNLVSEYKLKDDFGEPMHINVSRLRKTFANRIFELTDGDLLSTAKALGDTPKVTTIHYLTVPQEARQNWRFMGEVLVGELLTNTIGATYKPIPTGNCADPENGQFAPKNQGKLCLSFLNCVRCKHYVITNNDLYKLFSFYFRIYAERTTMNKRTWAKQFAHIPRLIDNHIIPEGIRRGVFKASTIETERKRALANPHPFWSTDTIQSLGLLA
jgi:hypothetical protein